MYLWKRFSNELDAILESLPRRLKLILLTVFFASAGIFVVATFYKMTYDVIQESRTPTPDDIEAARLRLELQRLKAAEGNVWSVEYERAEAQKQLERDRVAAQRKQLGLDENLLSAASSNPGVAALAAFGDVVSKNLLAIVAIGVLLLVYQSFSTDREHWRLVLHIALLLVLGGGFALFRGVSSETFVKVELKDFMGTVSSGSIGLYVMLFGTVLAGYALHVLRPEKAQPLGKLEEGDA